MHDPQTQPLDSCLDSDTLSAFFDHELELSESQLEHVAKCKKCSAFLHDFATIKSAFSQTVDAAIQDADLSARILSETRNFLGKKKIRPERHYLGLSFRQWIVRLALLFALLTTFLFLVFRNNAANQPPKPSPHHVAGSSSASPRLISASSASGAAPKHQTYRTPSAESYTGNPVEAAVPGAFAVLDRKTKSQIHPGVRALIPPRVSHDWASDSIEPHVIHEHIHSLLNQLDVKPEHFELTRSGPKLSGSVQLNRRQCPLLVRQFEDWGLKLFSVQQPQPRQTLFFGSGAEPVTYSFRILCTK